MKISILGKGLAGIVTALMWKRRKPDAEVEVIYDRDIATEPVGSGTFPGMTRLISESFGWDINWQNNPFFATPKTGIMYEGWGKKSDWFHPFGFHELAMHFDPQAFQDFVCESGELTISQAHVDSYDQVDADYLYDCTGFPKSFEDYDLLKNPLNRVMLANKPPEKLTPWTRTVATPDGWCFVIPLQNRIQLGYLFNDSITSDEAAANQFRSQFEVEDIRKTFSFKNYCAKNPLVDDRVMLNGNRLFFIEPMEATSVAGYMLWAKETMDMILDGKQPEEAVVNIKRAIYQNMNFILYHYQFGSRYNTPFWDYAKTLTIDDAYLHWIIRMRLVNQPITYGFHMSPSVLNMHEGLVGTA